HPTFPLLRPYRFLKSLRTHPPREVGLVTFRKNLEVAGHAILIRKRMRCAFEFQCLPENTVRISAAGLIGVHQSPRSKSFEGIRVPWSLGQNGVNACLLREVCKPI